MTGKRLGQGVDAATPNNVINCIRRRFCQLSLIYISVFAIYRFQLSDPTVGVDFFARIIEVKDGTRIKLQLWDTGMANTPI